MPKEFNPRGEATLSSLRKCTHWGPLGLANWRRAGVNRNPSHQHVNKAILRVLVHQKDFAATLKKQDLFVGNVVVVVVVVVERKQIVYMVVVHRLRIGKRLSTSLVKTTQLYSLAENMVWVYFNTCIFLLIVHGLGRGKLLRSWTCWFRFRFL